MGKNVDSTKVRLGRESRVKGDTEELTDEEEGMTCPL